MNFKGGQKVLAAGAVRLRTYCDLFRLGHSRAAWPEGCARRTPLTLLRPERCLRSGAAYQGKHQTCQDYWTGPHSSRSPSGPACQDKHMPSCTGITKLSSGGCLDVERGSHSICGADLRSFLVGTHQMPHLPLSLFEPTKTGRR